MLLSRREHGYRELCKKLVAKGFAEDLAEQAVEVLSTEPA